MSRREWNEITLLSQRRCALVFLDDNMTETFTSERMFKTRLAQWGYLKKMRDIDWQAVAVLLKARKTGQKASVFTVHDRKIKPADLRRSLKDRKISENDLLAEAAAND